MAPLQTHNLFCDIPAVLQEELVEILAESETFRIERIVSDGHATPQGEWYDQKRDEWVLLVSGGATLLFDNGAPPLILKPGDHIMIPANCRHRVERTDTACKTIWLAIHLEGKRPQ
jgi:cupin 2 domain-containing protein